MQLREVLVVDDDRDVRELLVELLQELELRVTAAADGDSAITALRREPQCYWLVVTDIVMPGVDGLAVLHAAKTANPGVRVVVASGCASPSTAAEAIRLGAAGYLSKPFTPRQVQMAVRRLIDAAGRYRPWLGVPFDAFARRRVLGAMLDELRSLDRAPRSLRRLSRELDSTVARLRHELGREPNEAETADAMDMTLEAYQRSVDQLRGVEGSMMRELDVTDEQGEPLIALRIGDDQHPDAQLERTEIREMVTEALTRLPDRERTILTLYYEKELTLKEIGEVIGVCESRVSQLRAGGVPHAHTPEHHVGVDSCRGLTRFPYISLPHAPITLAVMSVPHRDSRVVPLERSSRTERPPVTYEPRRSDRRDVTQDGYIDPDTAPGERPGRARFLLDDDGRVTEWNASAVRVTGLTADAVVGRFLWDLSGGRGRWAARARQTFGGGPDRPSRFEDWLWREHGRRTYVSVSLKPAPSGCWASMRDLTSRRVRDSRADALYAVGRAALDAKGVDDLSKRTLEALCRALDWEVGVFWEVDAAAGVLRCRRAVTVVNGDLKDTVHRPTSVRLARGEGLAGRVWTKGHPDSTHEGFDTHLVLRSTRMVTELRSGFAFPILGGSGTLGVFEFASTATETPGADLFRTVAIISNHISRFSERFRAEHALRESDAQKAAILSNALDGIIRVDAESRIVELNEEAERTFGCEPTAMLGRDLAALTVEPEGGEKILAALADLDQDLGGGGRRIHARLSRAAGEDFPGDLSITRIPLEGPTYFSICVRDLSEQERLQEALHHSQKMESLGLLASGIAHDFNNFLTVIRGQAERLVKNLTEDDTRLKWVKSILKVSERASALTGQLLAFGRREAGRVSVVDLNSIIESTAGLLSQQLGDAVLWKTSLSPTTGAARVGEGQAQQILFNLALNARDAMPDGGTLHVGTERVVLSTTEARRLLLTPGPYVRLWVKDNGRGMDARTQSRVFEPFFTTKKLGGGT